MLLVALALAAASPAAVCDAVWHDAARNRDIPVRVSLPAGKARVPVVVWSPGLGGDLAGGGVWARAWGAAGMATVQMQHHGSDAAVYRAGGTPEERRARVLAAITPEQQMARVGDARFVLSELARRPSEGACDLGRIDTGRAAIAGHSMGAWTAQGIAGQRFGGEPALRDTRFRAAIGFSPTGAPGTDSFARVGVPFLSITGTLDGAPATAPPEMRAAAMAQRSAPFRSMPADGGKCLLVFDNAEHMMFSGNRAGAAPVMAHVHGVSTRATTAFLLAALAGKPVDLGAVKPLLGAGDSLECK